MSLTEWNNLGERANDKSAAGTPRMPPQRDRRTQGLATRPNKHPRAPQLSGDHDEAAEAARRRWQHKRPDTNVWDSGGDDKCAGDDNSNQNEAEADGCDMRRRREALGGEK
jgi:hypothetical protein